MDVAILGAGVAGVSTAIALVQQGFKVSIYERHQGPQQTGAGIVLWPNAVFVLERLGVLEAIKAVSGCPAKMRRLSRTNEDLGSLDIELINAQMGFPSLSILRSDLQDILLSRLESLGVSVHYNHTITNICSNSRNLIDVHFQNGARITPDMVIGAEGRMASLSREFISGNNVPKFQNFINWVGVFESDIDIFGEISVSDFWGTGERFGIVPVSSRKAYWAGGIACTEIAAGNVGSYREELLTIFNDWPEPVLQMINESTETGIHKIYIHDHDPLRIWHKHNLIMIGDAAHASLPTSGQGACQALEDAWHMAECLTRSADDLERAYVSFTERRFAKTTGIIMAGRELARSLFKNDADYCKLRNEQSKNTDYTTMALAMAKGWGQGLSVSQ